MHFLNCVCLFMFCKFFILLSFFADTDFEMDELDKMFIAICKKQKEEEDTEAQIYHSNTTETSPSPNVDPLAATAGTPLPSTQKEKSLASARAAQDWRPRRSSRKAKAEASKKGKCSEMGHHLPTRTNSSDIQTEVKQYTQVQSSICIFLLTFCTCDSRKLKGILIKYTIIITF